MLGVDKSHAIKCIEFEAFEDCDNLVIYGEPGSYAQEYANKNNIPFEDIANKPIVTYGDLTGDGNVRFDDVQLALRIALRIEVNVSGSQLQTGDVMNCGDGINLTDAQAILMRALQVPVTFDAEK